MNATRKRVLWIDDEVEYLRSHIMFLETRGYGVTPVFSGEDGLALLRGRPDGFDIVLLDEQMPGMNGLDTLVAIKEMLPDLPVVMVTKSEEEQVMETALGLKIDGYLTKPVNPSQILMVCKKILQAEELVSTQLKHDFTRAYTINRDLLRNHKIPRDWEKLHLGIAKWDIELTGIKDEGIRQAHNGLRSDADIAFYEYVFGNYIGWMKGGENTPPLTTRLLPRYILPAVKQKKKIAMVILDSLRLDHYLAIQNQLKQRFSVENGLAWSVLPSAPEYARSSLLTGLMPDDIASRYPDEWRNILDAGTALNPYEASLFKKRMAESDAGIPDSSISFVNLSDENAGIRFEASMEEHLAKDVVVLNANFINAVLFEGGTSSLVDSIAADEPSLRSLVAGWFERSALLRIMEALVEGGFSILFTASSGCVLCTRGTEYYGSDRPRTNIRYRSGEGITCDERYALYIYEPQRYRLPADSPESRYIMLRENYHFIEHDVYQNYNEQYRPAFQRGGISMSEMIVPVAMLSSRK